MLLPEPYERPRSRRLVAAAPRPSVSPPRRPEVAPPPSSRRRTRWRRMVVLAALVFTAGAASGGLLGRRQEPAHRALLQAQANVPNARTATDGQNPAAESKPNRESKAPRPRRADHGSLTSSTKQEPHRVAPAKWAANVLGVTVGIDGKGVRVVWERPTESNHVVVVRELISARRSFVVFRGRATSFRDVSAHRCTAYRYIIINYDGRGHHSTGVPTSIVTQGCRRSAPRGSPASTPDPSQRS
jgi:hypothetical protein